MSKAEYIWVGSQTFELSLMPYTHFPRLPGLPKQSVILYALQQMAPLVGFPYSDDGTNKSVLLAGDLLVRSSFQSLMHT